GLKRGAASVLTLVSSAGTDGENAPCRVLMVLNAIIPATATTCRTRTISNARDSFMFGSDISSKSASDMGNARRAVVAWSFFLRRVKMGIFIFVWAKRAPRHGIDRRDRRNF